MKSSILAGIVWLINIKFQFLPSINLVVFLFGSIFFDLITGILKAKMRGDLITSYGYRKTVIKTAQYFGALLIVVMLRYVISGQEELLQHITYADYIINGVLIFSIFIEVTSALENIAELDKKSPFSKWIITPLLNLLTFQLKNNPFKRAADATKTKK